MSLGWVISRFWSVAWRGSEHRSEHEVSGTARPELGRRNHTFRRDGVYIQHIFRGQTEQLLTGCVHLEQDDAQLGRCGAVCVAVGRVHGASSSPTDPTSANTHKGCGRSTLHHSRSHARCGHGCCGQVRTPTHMYASAGVTITNKHRCHK